MPRLIPTVGWNRATVNYSMITRFKPAYIFRFFCLSLFRDEYYYVRITLSELRDLTGDKSLNDFNDKFREFLQIKSYYEDNGFEYKTRHNLYRVPPMELECVTFSRRLVGLNLDAVYIGFFMQLVLISKFANIELTRPKITKLLHMDGKTYDKYVSELLGELLSIKDGKLILKGEEYILESNFKDQRKSSRKDLEVKFVPQFIFKKK